MLLQVYQQDLCLVKIGSDPDQPKNVYTKTIQLRLIFQDMLDMLLYSISQ